VEVDVAGLREIAVEVKEQRHNIMGYRLPNGRWLSVLAEGRLVNLASGDGHPAEIMDMSFSIQALSARWLVERGVSQLINQVPREVDEDVALRKLRFEGCDIDTLTPAQKAYLESWAAE